MLALLGASLVPRERDVCLSRWPTHWLVQGADSANHVQNQTTRYAYMVTRQRKTDKRKRSNCYATNSVKKVGGDL